MFKKQSSTLLISNLYIHSNLCIGMNKQNSSNKIRIVIAIAVGLSIASQLMISPLSVEVQATNGLKVNLGSSAGNSGNGEYCVSGGGNTVCQNANVPGQVQINVGNVDEGGSIRGCVSFNGDTECDSGTNTSCKCPENLFVNFNSGNNNNGDSSSSSASASSSSSENSNSNSASSSSSLCLAFCNSPNSDGELIIPKNGNN